MSQRTAETRKGMAAMAKKTQFMLGAKASCADGSRGEVCRVIINPAGSTVTHLVVKPNRRHEPGRLVPVDLVHTTAGEVKLRCTTAEFDQLDPAEETELVEGSDAGSAAPPKLRSATAVGAMASSYRMPKPARTVVQEVVPAGETQVRHGEHVHARDGQIGRVQGFLIDPDDYRVTYVLLQEGHLWQRKEVAIPMSAVTEIQDGIELNITKQQVESLPPADINRLG
jgi:sporulation protein YlmC with PRC-barrel domain